MPLLCLVRPSPGLSYLESSSSHSRLSHLARAGRPLQESKIRYTDTQLTRRMKCLFITAGGARG
jgi:hypothetical protein